MGYNSQSSIYLRNELINAFYVTFCLIYIYKPQASGLTLAGYFRHVKLYTFASL